MKSYITLLLLATILPGLFGSALTDVFDNYINRAEPEYSWFYTGRSFSTLMGGTAYVLNVTSIRWLNDTEYKVKGGSSLWTHEVVVIVPKDLVYTNISTLYLASASDGCNNGKPIENTFNFDLEMGDVFSADSRAIGVVSFQTPNCPMTFADDPEKRGRHEDTQIAWSLH